MIKDSPVFGVGFDRGRSVRSDALTAEQQEILEKRGVLDPEDIHKLASKTRKDTGADSDKASCHSDFVSEDQAKKLQAIESAEEEISTP